MSVPAGYSWLCQNFNIQGAPTAHESFVSKHGRTVLDGESGIVTEYYGPTYYPGDTPFDHIEFALKYDGVNLDLLHKVFEQLGQTETARFIDTRPTGKYARQIGFLYEFLQGEELRLTKAIGGNYADILDSQHYVVSPVATKNTRWHVNNNLLGTRGFCPILRRTGILDEYLKLDLTSKIHDLTDDLPPELLRRAADFLYSKETKSSNDIEREKSSPDREARFMEALRDAGNQSVDARWTESELAKLQNTIVDPRYAQSAFRTNQNYVGETRFYHEKVHYVCPPPQFVPSLMSGIAGFLKSTDGAHPVVRAAIASFGFVFVHPFEDGNGRIHRFMIHDILARDCFIRRDMILPVSAYMLRNMSEYDRALERFSAPLSQLVHYEMDNDSRLTVTNPAEVEGYYRYPDMTFQTEYLFRAVDKTIDADFTNELKFLRNYDEARNSIRSIIDMPDRRLDLLMKVLHQNRGKLSKGKRDQFSEIRDAEMQEIEGVFQDAFIPGEPPTSRPRP